MSDNKQLLAIIEHGGYPNLLPLYQELGLTTYTAPSMRKGLSLCKKHKPDIVVAEFIYAPTYGSYICNLESLFAFLQRSKPDTQLIVFIEKEHLHHLEKVADRFPIAAVLTHPIQRHEVEAKLRLHV
ncbi:MAG: hypothetical protein Q9N68_10305 [Gammaproteobacteria bacterium]|nr:hypothetical protein [Gammaproteobacteria bacterium]